MHISKYKFQPHGDNRGQLVSLEELKDIPFMIKRVYYMYDTVSNVIRGKHAHKSLKQILICLHGSVKILLDNGHEKEEILLDDPTIGLYVENVVWRELFDFSPDAVLVVLASEYYDEGDYIRNYNDFISYINMLEEKESK